MIKFLVYVFAYLIVLPVYAVLAIINKTSEILMDYLKAIDSDILSKYK